MKRLVAPLIAGAIAVSMLLGSAGIADASTRRPGRLDAGALSRTYMNSAMLDYTHMNSADFADARGSGWSCWSIATSSGVAPGTIVNAAVRRAQSVVSGRVRQHRMSRSAARSFMRTFRADCWKYLGTAQTPPSGSVPPTGTPGYPRTPPSGSVAPTGTPGYGYDCGGPWAPGVPPTSTPSVPTTSTWTPCVPPTSTPTVPPMVGPGSGWGPGMCW